MWRWAEFIAIQLIGLTLWVRAFNAGMAWPRRQREEVGQ